jgi:hypothetical protein
MFLVQCWNKLEMCLHATDAPACSKNFKWLNTIYFQICLHKLFFNFKFKALQLSMLTETFLFFSKWKGHNSAKNHRTMTKFELDMGIPLTYPYVKFELNIKLKILSRGITVTKIIWPIPNSNLTCIFLWYTYVKFELNVCDRYKDNERKLMMTEWRN